MQLEPLLPTYLERFFEQIYPLCPIIDQPMVYGRVAHRQYLSDRPFAALLLCLASLAQIVPTSGSSDQRADHLMDEAIKLHNTSALGSKPSLEEIATSMLIGTYVRARGNSNGAYLRTKESVGLAELMRLHSPDAYGTFSETEKEIALRIFWILSVAEKWALIFILSRVRHSHRLFLTRSTSLIESRPISLRSKLDLIPQSTQSRRLAPITQLFNVLDAQLVDCINGTCSGSENGCNFDVYRAMLVQQSLASINADDSQSEVQIVDVALTKEWLQTKIWQVCVSHSTLVFGSPFVELRVEYPLVKLVSSAEIIRNCSVQALKGNGQCMVSHHGANAC